MNSASITIIQGRQGASNVWPEDFSGPKPQRSFSDYVAATCAKHRHHHGMVICDCSTGTAQTVSNPRHDTLRSTLNDDAWPMKQ